MQRARFTPSTTTAAVKKGQPQLGHFLRGTGPLSRVVSLIDLADLKLRLPVDRRPEVVAYDVVGQPAGVSSVEQVLEPVYFRLDPQVAPLAERGEVPPLQVKLVSVEMVDGQGEPVLGVVRMVAPLAPPVRPLLDQRGDLRPVRRVPPALRALDLLDQRQVNARRLSSPSLGLSREH